MDIRATQKSIEVFCCYARKDQLLLDELKKHLMPLRREGLITLWTDTNINAGAEWKKEIHRHLDTAQMILLLVSPDFVASEYCYSVEMQRAMKRHEHGEARVIPIILRPVSWQKTPLGKLQALPTDASPITSRKWHHQDEAFYNVAEGIRDGVEDYLAEEERVRKAVEAEQARLAEEERLRKVKEEQIPFPTEIKSSSLPFPSRPSTKATVNPAKSSIPLGLAGLVITALVGGIFWFTIHHTYSSGRILSPHTTRAHPSPDGVITEFPLSTPTSNPSWITAGPDGNLWFTEPNNGKIGRISPSGKIAEFPLSTPSNNPLGITTGPDGNLWFTESDNSKIGRISPSGKITEFPLSTPISDPSEITAGPDGNLWFTEPNNGKIGRITSGK